MKTSLSDKIAVLLAWVLVHTAIGIIFIHVNKFINDPTIEILAYVLNFYISYKWSSKMVTESKRVFNYQNE
jgi:hypothetical protein